jgi:hypothetical protein
VLAIGELALIGRGLHADADDRGSVAGEVGDVVAEGAALPPLRD